MEHFTTARLVARDWTAADAQAAFGIYGRDEVMRWLGAQPRRPVPSTEAMSERLARMIEQGRDRPEYGLWPLVLRETGELVGAVLLQPLPAMTARSRSAGTLTRTTGAMGTPLRPPGARSSSRSDPTEPG